MQIEDLTSELAAKLGEQLHEQIWREDRDPTEFELKAFRGLAFYQVGPGLDKLDITATLQILYNLKKPYPGSELETTVPRVIKGLEENIAWVDEAREALIKWLAQR